MQSLRCFFIEPANGIFSHPTVYGRVDDAARFEFFCKVSMLHPSLLQVLQLVTCAAPPESGPTPIRVLYLRKKWAL